MVGGKGRRKSTTEVDSGRPERLRHHRSGDEHSRLGFQYECGMRCLWLLYLRGSAAQIGIGQGEDCRITTDHGVKVYRQVKKREGDKWNPSDRDFRKFVQRAYDRFSADPTVRHEFYTNAPVDRELVTGKYDGRHLNPDQRWLAEIGGHVLNAFCASISIKDQCYQPDPKIMESVVCEAIRDEIDQEYPGSQANDLALTSQVRDIAQRLLASEFKLLSTAREVSWDDIEVEIRLDHFIRSLETIARGGGAIIPWSDASCDPHRHLPRDAALAVIAINSKNAITRPSIENQALAQVNDWLGGNDVTGRVQHPRSLRLVLLAGPHGSGKTWALMRLGSRLAAERPDVAVVVARAPFPDDWREFSKMGLTSSRPQIIMIDDILSDWHHMLALPRSCLPERILFLGTASCDMGSPELLALREKISEEMEVVPVPWTMEEQELHEIALILGRLLPSNRETAEISRTNIRHAVEILQGREPVPHHAEFETQLHRHINILGSILFCTARDLPLPVSLFERAVGHTLPLDLSAWILPLEKGGHIALAFEDPHEADTLLKKVLGESKHEMAFALYDKLLEHCEPARKEERVFTRRLLTRLSNGEPALAARLLRSRATLVRELVRHEPTWALAYCWLPLFEHAEMAKLLEAAVSRLARPPESVAEFALWIEAYGTTTAAHYLNKRISLLQGWDVGLLVRTAKMLARLPRKEQARLARRFCTLLMNLPSSTRYQCFTNAFTLLVSLVASSGRSYDREKGVKVVGEVLEDYLREGRSISPDRYEAYLTLIHRTFAQERAGLSIEITRALVTGDIAENILERYEVCLDREHRLAIRPLVDLSLELLAGFRDAIGEVAKIGDSVPSNVVKLAVMWAQQSDKERLLEEYLSCIEALSFTSVPLDRVASILHPFPSIIRHCSPDARRRLLAALLRWAPQDGMVATEETGKFLLRLLRFVVTQYWLNSDAVEGSRKVLFNLALGPQYAYEIGREILTRLTMEMRGSTLNPDTSLGLPDEWWHRPGLANEYLIQTAALDWSPVECGTLAGRMRELWTGQKSLWLNLSMALLRLGDWREGYAVATQMAATNPGLPDPHGLLAVASALRSDIDAAYAHLAQIVSLWDRYQVGLKPWLAFWVHRELSEITRGVAQEMHIVCTALVNTRRLPGYNQLWARDREPVEPGDDAEPAT